MLDIVGIFLICAVASLFLTFVVGIFDVIKNKKLTDKSGVAIVVSIIIVALLILLAGWMYFTAIGMPYEYAALRDSADEVKSLLLQYANQSEKSGTMIDIDEGLESLGYKIKLPKMITDANEKKASIDTWLRNPLMPFKEELRAGLPADW